MLAFIAFITSPIGRLVARLAFGLMLFVAGFAYGHHVADQGAEIAALKLKVAAAQFDTRAAVKLHQEAQAAADRLQQNEAARTLQVQDYANAISKLTEQTRTCRVATDDDIRRLRNIK